MAKTTLPDGTRAGKFRWAVKTLQDSAAQDIDFGVVLDVTLAEIAGWHPVHVSSQAYSLARGAGPQEFKVYRVRGQAVKMKLEVDGDYHFIIEDTEGSLLGCEIVQPAFAKRAIKLNELRTVRQTLEDAFGASPRVDQRYRKLEPGQSVTITGVGFWDELHGQGGDGNGFELHPVLSMEVH